MKVTDYCPRAAPFDTYLTGRDLVGAEVGVDVGAHAEALLLYLPDIRLLHLIDPWPNDYCRGYCEGRLLRFRSRIVMRKETSAASVVRFAPESLDFVYIDQVWQDRAIVAEDLALWWPTLKRGGILGRRNYTGRGEPCDVAVDEFAKSRGAKVHHEKYGADAVIVKP